MTHSSGISATTELKSAISQAKLGQIRLIKMIIDSENLSLEKVIKPIGTWQQDFDNSVLPCLKVNQPCYILYKLDSKYHQDGSPEWLLITYVPDTTQTREKMIYASTKMTMKKAISALHIKYDYAATTMNECSYEGFNSYIRSLTAPKPLTKAEIELQQIKKNEEEMRTQGKKQTLQSISFPLTPELENALLLFKSVEVNYIQICIDIAKEVISLAATDKITTAQLRNLIPTDKPRYHLFSFNHRGNIFIHSIPVGKSTIKEKMLYSTCKMTFLQRVEADLKIPIARKIETDSPDELTEEYLVDQLSSSSSFPPTAARFNNAGAVGDVNFRHQSMFHNLGSPAFH